MDNFTDLVHKDHHILLQDFCSICKITDIAESEDTHNLSSRQDRVDTAA